MKSETKEDIYHRELHTLLRFSAVINSSLKLEEVLDIAMKWAEEFMDAEASSVYELDEEKNQLFVRLARGEKKEPIQGITLKVGEGIAGFVAQSGRPMVVQDVEKEGRFSDKFDKSTGFQTRALISVPLILRNKTIGVLQVINKKSNQPFTDHDLELLNGMAPHIAMAIENAKLYHRLEEKFELTAQELKFAQDKLIRSGRLAAMGHLVQGIAHEIRNPVMTIGGFAMRIKKGLGKKHKLLQYVDIIMDESSRLEKLVTKVRQFTEVQSAILSANHICPIIRQVIDRFKPTALSQGVQMIEDLPSSLPPIKMDVPQMVIALSNVVENGLDAMPRGGILSFKAYKEDTSICIEVSDTGYGIRDVQINAVYDPFVTSKTQGVGLGLTMVHQIVMNHLGEIDLRSELEKGTTVIIRLPLDGDALRQEL